MNTLHRGFTTVVWKGSVVAINNYFQPLQMKVLQFTCENWIYPLTFDKIIKGLKTFLGCSWVHWVAIKSLKVNAPWPVLLIISVNVSFIVGL